MDSKESLQMLLPHFPRLLGYARRETTSEAVAEDAVQEALLMRVQHADELRPDAELLPGAYAILRRILVDRRRRELRGPQEGPTEG